MIMLTMVPMVIKYMSQNKRYMIGRSMVELIFIPRMIRNTSDITEKNIIAVNMFIGQMILNDILPLLFIMVSGFYY